MAREPSHRTACWLCGTTVLTQLYGIGYFSYAIRRRVYRWCCYSCWVGIGQMLRAARDAQR